MQTVAVSAAAALVVAAVAIWRANRTKKQISRLADAAMHVAQTGDLSTRVSDTKGAGQVRVLAGNLNSALAHVQEMYTALERVLIQQRRFIHDASHELRTPLTTVSSTLEALTLLPEMEAKQRIEIIDGALAESKRMKHLVNGLLLLAAIDSGGGITRKSYKWREVLDPAAEYAQANLAPRQVELEIEKDLGSGWGDAEALQQMIERCIHNIHDHTPENAIARISARKVGEEAVEIAISDDGPGVSDKALPTLTSRFVRIDASRTDGKPGLGLSIANAIAGAHAGTLVVEPVKPHGLRITATIPRGKAGGRPERRRAPRPRKDDASKS